MISRIARVGGLSVICLALGAAMLLTGKQIPASSHNRVPLVQDWSHQHMIFSRPSSLIQNLKVQRQTRYVEQVLRRNPTFLPPPIPRNPGFLPPINRGPVFGRPPIVNPHVVVRQTENQLHADWQVLMPGANYTMGDGVYPAKYTFDTTSANCANDFAVFTTSQAGGSTTTTIYALNELYQTTCTAGPVPSVLWAYHVQTGVGGKSASSPVVSYDGTQIVWVEGGSGTATLHFLKPYTGGAGTAGSLAVPATPTASGSAADYRACTPTSVNEGCLYSISFANGADDTGASGAITPSSPYYEYAYDLLFVGDDSGALHEFTGIFDGSPAEVTSSGWPVTVHSGVALTSPVYDDTSGNVFVGDSGGQLSYVAVTPITFAGTLGTSNWQIGTSITDGPIVDGTSGEVFVFAQSASGAVVGEDNTTLSSGANRTGPVVVGSGTAHKFHTGDFDNNYYTSDTGAGAATGNLYVCGYTAANIPALYQIGVSGGTISASAPTEELLAATASTPCSAVTEFYNPNSQTNFPGLVTTDSLFFSVQASGETGTFCVGNGCVYAVSLSGSTATLTGAFNASGGTSGIVVDNYSTSTGASNLYYSWLGNSSATYPCVSDTSGKGCTVQVSQGGLGSLAQAVQGAGSDAGAGKTISNTFFSSPVTANDLLLVFAHWDAALGPPTTASISDSAGDTFTSIDGPVSITETDDQELFEVWYAKKTLGGGETMTLTLSGASVDISLIEVIEYSGLDNTAPLDVHAFATGLNSTSLSSGASPTTTATNDTIIGVFGDVQPSSPYTAGPGFTQVFYDSTSMIEQMPVASKSSYTATATSESAHDWAAFVIAFKDAVQ